MNTIIDAVPVMTIEEFADRNNLTMHISERRHVPVGAPSRFYAYFARVEVAEDGMLSSEYGDGASHDEAIANYARAIETKHLAVNAMLPERQDIDAPRFCADDN